MPYLIYLLLLLYSTASLAQDRYNDIWFFGKGHSVHFNNATINNGGIPTPPVQGIYSTYATVPFYQNAVTHPNTGTLEFFIQLPNKSQGSVNRTYQVYYDHTGQPLPNGAIDIPYYEGKLGIPVIVPHPSNNRQYYVFTLLNQGLQYTVVDMSLNNGKGAVMPNKKMVSLAPNGTIVGNKITVTQGCNDIKLIVISQAEQAFLSYEIDMMGHINTTPIRSPLSSERIIQYSKPSAYLYPGMKTAPDGKRLAIASINGTYMYSVNACDGSITNEQHIDTVKSFGVGFSPNSQILYFNRAEYNSRYTNSSELVQCDIAPTRSLNEIINSKTVILQNYIPGHLHNT